MKKNTLICIAIGLLVITIILIIRNMKSYVYIENKQLHICQKCIVINNEYYCQIYGGDK